MNRIELWRSLLRADILFSRGAISITFTEPRAHTWLGLQISCEQLDWQLSSISQICGLFSSFISGVEELDKTAGPSRVPDDMDNDQWLQLIRAFVGAKGIHVPGEFVTDILHALRLADERHDVVLPALQNLHVKEPTPVALQDSVDSFVSQRQLTGHPVRIYTDPRYELLCPGVWEKITGGAAMFHQTPGWKWEGHMDTPDQPWLISTS